MGGKKSASARLALVPPIGREADQPPAAEHAAEVARALERLQEADERIIAEICRRPDLLTRALERDPQLILKAIGPFPAQRRKVREMLQELDKRKGRGKPGHAPETRAVIRLLDGQLRAEGWAKDTARHSEIARHMQVWSPIFGDVKAGAIREILAPRTKRRR